MSGKRDSNPRPPAWKADALSTELLPQTQGPNHILDGQTPKLNLFLDEQVLLVVKDSNSRRHKPTDLQSVPFDQLRKPPIKN